MWNRLSAMIRAPDVVAAESWSARASSRRTLAVEARVAASRAAAPETALCSSVRSRSVADGHRPQPVAERAELRGGRPSDEGAAGPAATGLHQALLAEHGEGLAQRHRGDAELGGELRLGREPLAVSEQAELYRLADAEHDLLRPARGGQRGDERNRVPTVSHARRLSENYKIIVFV